MTVDDLEVLRSSLRARVEECLDRLDDVVSELIEVHQMTSEEVIARVVGLTRLDELERGEDEAL